MTEQSSFGAVYRAPQGQAESVTCRSSVAPAGDPREGTDGQPRAPQPRLVGGQEGSKTGTGVKAGARCRGTEKGCWRECCNQEFPPPRFPRSLPGCSRDSDHHLDRALQRPSPKAPTPQSPRPRAALLPSPPWRGRHHPLPHGPRKPAAPRTGCLVSCHREQPTSLQGECYFYPGNGWQLPHCSQPPPAPAPARGDSRLPSPTQPSRVPGRNHGAHPHCRRGKRYPQLEACAALQFRLQ